MTRDEAKESEALAALGLEPPLRRLSQLGVDEWTVRRMWETIQRRTSGAQRLAPRRGRARAGMKWRLTLALGLLVTGVLITGLLEPGWFGLRSPLRPTAFQGPLVTSEGKRFESVEAAAATAAHVSFADGSQIEASPGARVEGLAATASEFVLLVRRGRARFAVHPGGPRRWLIETRGASVEVVGTVLSVESGTGFVAVRVEKGVVLVRSPLLADGVQRLSAGQALRLSTGSTPEEESTPTTAAADAVSDAPAPAEAEAPPDAADTADATETGESEASPAEHTAMAQPQAPRRAVSSAAELWSRADAARRAGQAARAAALLERLLHEHPGDSQAALGAYTLGVLQLEQLARPRAAARRFRQALELGIAIGLRESCYVRWTEALRQVGDDGALRQVAREYLRSYPMGEQRDAMQKLLERSDAANSLSPSPGERPK